MHALEDLTHEPLHDLQHFIAIDEGHLQIDLRELRLPVGAGVLVAQALADLHVPVASGDHQDLLEDLRALRQCIPLPGVDPGRHDEVACSLRCALDEQRGLNLDEVMAVESITRATRAASWRMRMISCMRGRRRSM